MVIDTVIPDSLLEATKVYYEEPHRKYHNWAHIQEMFYHAPKGLTPEQQIAILFHDLVYVPGAESSLNEQMSIQMIPVVAQMAGSTATKFLESVDQVTVKEIILSTINHSPRCQAAEIVLDLDLLRFGARGVKYYMCHSTAIQQEYAHVDAEVFCLGRISVLESFLNRKRIYITQYAYNKWEQTARNNIEAELAQLITTYNWIQQKKK